MCFLICYAILHTSFGHLVKNSYIINGYLKLLAKVLNNLNINLKKITLIKTTATCSKTSHDLIIKNSIEKKIGNTVLHDIS